MRVDRISSWIQYGNALLLECPNGIHCRIDALTPHVVRVRASHKGRFPVGLLNKYGFVDDGAMAQDGTFVNASEQDDHIVADTGALKLCWERECGRFTLRDSEEGFLLEGADEWLQLDSSGYEARFAIDEDEKFYGFGDQNRQRLEHRGTRPRMWIVNVKRYIPIPFFMSSKGYGIFVNTTRDIAFDVGAGDPSVLSFASPSGYVDFYVIHGPSLSEMLDRYTQLTGRPVLPPKWSFGLWFICRTQANDHEVITDAYTMRREDIPCDVIGLEPGWMATHYDTSTRKDWHPERFPRPKSAHLEPYTFTAALKRMGYKIELWECNDYDLSIEAERRAGTRAGGIRDAALSENAASENENRHPGFVEPDEYLNKPRKMDRITIPEEPWFEHHKKFIDQGVDFFKQDGAYQVLDHPDRFWANGLTDADMHNLYPLLYSQQMYEGFKEYTSRRPCCYTPTGWAGLQRYTGTWTGDTGGRAETLVACLNLALSGHHLVTCDMDVTAKESIHYGFLLPWSVVNSWNYWRHPWLLGEELGTTFKEYARLRSRLLPYLYSCAYDAHHTGIPILRPMVLAYPEERACHDRLYQYMLGPSLLVGAFTDEIYLPHGEWYDYWTAECYTGGQALRYTPPEDRGGALFVKAGTLLPTQKTQPFTGADKSKALIIEVFPGQIGSFALFDDDGVSVEYERGMFARTELSLREKSEGTELEVSIGERIGTYTGMPEQIPTTLKIVATRKPVSVSQDGRDLRERNEGESGEGKWYFDGRHLWVMLGGVPRAGCACRVRW